MSCKKFTKLSKVLCKLTQDGALLACMGGCIEGGTSSDSDSSENDSEDSNQTVHIM